jgi:hypothetical protein
VSYTLDENGTALTESVDGVTMPVDCSFDIVNDWIHGIDVQFEELQALCLGMASENDKLKALLKNHVLLPCGSGETEGEEFFDKILIHFVGEGGDTATAIENHRNLCEYLKHDDKRTGLGE